MPIPTRSMSLREPRQQTSSSSSGLRRPTTRSGTTSLASGISDSATTTNTATDTAVGVGNTLNRSKTLLPQRRSSVLADHTRDNSTGSGSTSTTQLRFQEQRPRPRGHTTTQIVQQREQQQKQQQQQQPQPQPKQSSLVNRRKSSIRPTELRIPSSKTTISTTGTGKRDATELQSPSLSPRKSAAQPDVATKNVLSGSSSPKKTSTDMMMPPPPLPQARHGRSISLKQPPVTVGSGPASPSSAVPAGHVRRHSQVVKGQTANGKTGRSTGPTTSSSTASTAQRTKRQLTTFQQNSAPKKAVKPPTPTSASTSDRTDVGGSLIPSSWPEVASLQTEILQLSLLHSAYLQGDVEWRANAEASLRRKYDSVAGSYRSVLAEEEEIQRRLNSQALNLWLENTRDNHNGHGFPEQIQTLSSVVQDISDLSDSSGRYACAVCAFEDWFEKADRIRRCRDRLDQGRGYTNEEVEQGSDFIDPLGVSWKKELYGLTTKLELCARELQGLDILGYREMEMEMDEDHRQNHDNSALIRLVMGVGDMITSMIEEINTMRIIEDEIVRSERGWVSRRTKQLAVSSPCRLGEDRVGIWKSALKRETA